MMTPTSHDVVELGKPPTMPGDELFERAIALAQESSRLSVSLLQRRLGIGYPRAARRWTRAEERGIVPSADDGRPGELGALPIRSPGASSIQGTYRSFQV